MTGVAWRDATAGVKSALLELLPESLKLIFNSAGSLRRSLTSFSSPLDRSGHERLHPRAGVAVKQIVRGYGSHRWEKCLSRYLGGRAGGSKGNPPGEG